MSDFEQYTRKLLQQHVTATDASIRRRLDVVRKEVLEETARSAPVSPWIRHTWVPAGLIVAGVAAFAIVLTFRQHAEPKSADITAEIELLADGDILEILEDESDFYDWAITTAVEG